MLVNMKEMLKDAAKGGYAVGGFNCASLESAVAAVRASEEMGMPFILQHTPAHEQYLPLSVAGPIMLQLARAAKTPVAVHLDHGASVAHCLYALAMGFPSVMFDGSMLSLEDNIAATATVAKTAHELGATVEAELGSMPCNFKGNLRIAPHRPRFAQPETDKYDTFIFHSCLVRHAGSLKLNP